MLDGEVVTLSFLGPETFSSSDCCSRTARTRARISLHITRGAEGQSVRGVVAGSTEPWMDGAGRRRHEHLTCCSRGTYCRGFASVKTVDLTT